MRNNENKEENHMLFGKEIPILPEYQFQYGYIDEEDNTGKEIIDPGNKYLRIAFNDIVLLGKKDYFQTKYAITVKFKPLFIKWLKDFREVSLDFNFGLGFTQTKTNYSGKLMFHFSILGLVCYFGKVN